MDKKINFNVLAEWSKALALCLFVIVFVQAIILRGIETVGEIFFGLGPIGDTGSDEYYFVAYIVATLIVMFFLCVNFHLSCFKNDWNLRQCDLRRSGMWDMERLKNSYFKNYGLIKKIIVSVFGYGVIAAVVWVLREI